MLSRKEYIRKRFQEIVNLIHKEYNIENGIRLGNNHLDVLLSKKEENKIND